MDEGAEKSGFGADYESTRHVASTRLSGPPGDSGDCRRVVFIGGLEDGRMSVEVLQLHERVELVGVFVLTDEAGKKVAGYRTFDDLVKPGVLRKIERIKDHAEEISALRPDLIIIVGFSQIIPPSVLSIPPMGTVGFHSALLPGRRGCSPLIWAMVDGLKESGVTMFFMSAGIDSGDIIGKEAFAIEERDFAEDVIQKANASTISLLKTHLDDLLDGKAPRLRHDTDQSVYTRRRTPADGEIDWSKPGVEIVNLIRALAPPYPMAHTFGGDGVPILIERAHLAPNAILPRRQVTSEAFFRQTVLCVAAHPDDEVLGVGGTLALHARAGAKVVVLILAEGEAEKLSSTPRCAERTQRACDAKKVMGVAELICCDFPDQRLDTVPLIEIVKTVEAAIDRFRPSVVYTHHGGDANTDHLVTFKATYAACRPMTPLGECISTILTFETPSSTDQAPQLGQFVFNPTFFVDVESVWDIKVNALKCYTTELIGGRHPRSLEYIKSLARMRGGYGGYLLAEAFVLARQRLSSTRPVEG